MKSTPKIHPAITENTEDFAREALAHISLRENHNT